MDIAWFPVVSIFKTNIKLFCSPFEHTFMTHITSKQVCSENDSSSKLRNSSSFKDEGLFITDCIYLQEHLINKIFPKSCLLTFYTSPLYPFISVEIIFNSP